MWGIGVETLFREPEGPRSGAVFVALALLCFGIYGYFHVLYAHSSPLMLALGGMNLLVALPDFLPRERTTLAGALRIFNVLVGIVVLAYVLLQY